MTALFAEDFRHYQECGTFVFGPVIHCYTDTNATPHTYPKKYA
jgi:hypothetical protein